MTIADRVRIEDVKTLSDDWSVPKKVTFFLRTDGTWQRRSRETCDRGNGATILRWLPTAVLLALCSGCGVTGADPTGTAAMIQFEAHRQQSIEMQRQATSVQSADEREANIRNAIQFCREHPEVQGCPDVVRDEAETMETMRKMRSIGSR